MITYFVTGFILALIFSPINALIVKKNGDVFDLDEEDAAITSGVVMIVSAILFTVLWIVVIFINLLAYCIFFFYKKFLQHKKK